jgi:hypothetical protein
MEMKRKQCAALVKTAFGVCFLAGITVLWGCDYLPLGTVSIQEILSSPTKYDGKEVKVKGVVSDVTKIPLVGVRFYVLSDEGRQILVVPRESVPESRSRVTVIGVVRNIAIIAGESVGPHLEEVRRLDHGL